MTRYQEMIVKYLEARYSMSADKVIRWLHKRNRYCDIAELVGCGTTTLYRICKELGIDEPSPTIVDRAPRYLNATEFFKQFDNIEDAVVECRDPDRLGLTVAETAKKLGACCASVVRHTPAYLKFTYNHSGKGQRSQRTVSSDHPWRVND